MLIVEGKRGIGTPPRWRPVLWLIVLALVLAVHACTPSKEPEPTALPSPEVAASPTSGLATFASGAPTRRAPTPTSPVLPTVTPRSEAVATPSPPEEREIVNAVLGQGTGEHWVTYPVTGSFTAHGADETLAMVGNVGELDEIRWVVLGRPEGEWRLLGTSSWLGSGFDAPPPFYLAPDLIDFDRDGRQELLNHYFRMQGGWMTAADSLYRWDGQALARIWRADTTLDNTAAENQDVPQPYRENYQAEWEWADLNGDRLDEILLRERATFHPADQAQAGIVLGGEAGERAFRWDGEALRPYAAHGPAGNFAYTVLGELWLWENHAAHPLGVKDVRKFYWSPDGSRLGWWARPSSEGAEPAGATVGIYDLATDTRQEFFLGAEQEPVVWHWAADGRLFYALPGQPLTRIDLETGRMDPLPDVPVGTWSPDGSLVAYERDGALYLYDLEAGQERSLVVAPEGIDAPAVLPDPVWSPRGDWIACYLAQEDLIWVGLVTPDPSGPVSSAELLGTFVGRESPGLRFAWSADGSRLAVLTSDSPFIQPPAGADGPNSANSVNGASQLVLYVGDVVSDGDERVGRPEWQAVLELEATAQVAGPALSPNGERVALAADGEVWEVIVPWEEEEEGAASLQRQFSMPDLQWTVLEWAPGGSGFLVGLEWVYGEHLYWFPAGEADPVLLLADSLGPVRWSPQVVDGAGMVLLEYTETAPLLHYVSRDGSTTVIQARGADRFMSFEMGGGRVYYSKFYADRNGSGSLYAYDSLAGCQSPLASPDGHQLAWLCDDGVPEWSDLISGTAEINFRLVTTNGEGRRPREVWSYLETGPDYRSFSLVSWRRDGQMIYLSRPKYGTAWAYFDYNPGIVALDLNTGKMERIGDTENVHDGLVSPDGVWLAQSKVTEWPEEGVFVSLRSVVNGTEREVASAEQAKVAGDFSFSPGNTWLAWREWATARGGSIFLIRVLKMPDGEPLTVYAEAELTAPAIGGWIGPNQLVLVYPRQDDGTGGHTTVVTLPAVGGGEFLSPFTFLGTYGSAP